MRRSAAGRMAAWDTGAGCARRHRRKGRPVAVPGLAVLGVTALGLAAMLAAVLAPAAPARAEDGKIVAAVTGADRPARFEVGSRVVQPAPMAFTATVNEIGNGARMSADSGFEPKVFRTMFLATEDAPDRVITEPALLSIFDSLRTGALDGAEVEVLRIENGVLRSVRRDRIPPGGFQVSDWVRVTRGRSVPAGTTGFDYVWDRWNRADAPDYFTVRAIDDAGGLSPAAAAVAAQRPDKISGQRPTPDNPLQKIDISGGTSALPAPGNLRAEVLRDGVARLSWDPVPGAAGYAVFRADTPPETHRGHYIALQGTGEPVRAGDLVILRHKVFVPDRSKLVTNRTWDANQGRRLFGNWLLQTWPDDPSAGPWELVRHAPDTPVTEPGETFLRLTPVLGQRQQVGLYNHSGVDQDWYEVLEPGHSYRVEFWLRGNSLKPLRFELQGPHGVKSAVPVPPVSFVPTPDWRKVSTSFSIPRAPEGRQPGKMQLRIEGPAQVDIDNLRIFRADVPFLALLPEDKARLQASGFSMLRTHSLIKSGISTYDLGQLTNPGGVISGAYGNTLPQLLDLIGDAGMQPWLQIEPHLSRDEWLGLAEYLAAPFDPARDDAAALPWAAKRVAQGHAAPWIEDFDTVFFEIGNETWNRLFSPWIFRDMRDAVTGAPYRAGEVYGIYQEYVLSILRESPYWPQLQERLVPLLGGWAGGRYGFDAAAHSPQTPLLTNAAYIGGWDEGEGPARPDAQGFSSVLTNVLQTGLPRLQQYEIQLEKLKSRRSEPLQLGTYEAGPGYVMNGLNGARVSKEQLAEQEKVMKSAAAGTATLDNFLAGERAGMVVQNFFTYSSGTYWTSHARWNRGGQTYPSWELLALYQRVAKGDMLEVRTLEVPRIDLPKAFRRQPVRDGALAAVYATRDGDRLSVIAISRRVPGYPDPADDGLTRMEIDLPITAADSLTLYRLSGEYSANNLTSAAAVPEAEPLPVEGHLPRLTIDPLPPGEALLFVFDGVHGS